MYACQKKQQQQTNPPPIKTTRAWRENLNIVSLTVFFDYYLTDNHSVTITIIGGGFL